MSLSVSALFVHMRHRESVCLSVCLTQRSLAGDDLDGLATSTVERGGAAVHVVLRLRNHRDANIRKCQIRRTAWASRQLQVPSLHSLLTLSLTCPERLGLTLIVLCDCSLCL